jgi:beta-lactamase regulating signal transducer with metallopeptidase domain
MTADSVLGWLGEASIVLGVVVLVVLLARALARTRLGAGWTYAFWLAVPAALLATAAPSGLFPAPFALSVPLTPDPGAVTAWLAPSDASSGSVSEFSVPSIPSAAVLAAWLVGAAGVLVLHFSAQWRFGRIVVARARRPTGEERVVLAAAAIGTGLAPDRRFRISDQVESPVACGLHRPTVVLPEGFLAAYGRDERRVMVLHEAEHVRARHLWHRAAATLVRGVFWFHPLAWLGERAFIADQELACDQGVLGRDASIRPRTYAATLLKIARRIADRAQPVPAAGAPLVAVNRLKERTVMLERHASLAGARCAGLLALAVVAGASVAIGLSGSVAADAREAEAPPRPVIVQNARPVTEAARPVVRAEEARAGLAGPVRQAAPTEPPAAPLAAVPTPAPAPAAPPIDAPAPAGAPAQPDAPAPADEATTCRRIVKPAEDAGQVLCGTADQWAEFDRRVALINEGVICRWAPTRRGQVCMTEEQWRVADRRERNFHDAARMGMETRTQWGF